MTGHTSLFWQECKFIAFTAHQPSQTACELNRCWYAGSCRLVVSLYFSALFPLGWLLQVVLEVLLSAAREGKRFRVLVVDSRPELEGRRMMQRLLQVCIWMMRLQSLSSGTTQHHPAIVTPFATQLFLQTLLH